MKQKAIFLDKDGTLTKDIPYNVKPELIQLTTGAVDGLRLLQKAGYQLIVVTNQSGVARGYFDEPKLKQVKMRLMDLLSSAGVELTDFYYCPHHPEGKVAQYAIECKCRKPQPGLLYRAAREHGICLTESWLVGDVLTDIEAGNQAGCRTVLINNKIRPGGRFPSISRPTVVRTDLTGAAQVITQESSGMGRGIS